MNDSVVMFYLKANLDSLKKQLGKQCSYLAFVETKKQLEDGSYIPFYGVKANIDGALVEVGFKKEFKEFVPEDFENIYNILIDKNYESQAAV